MLEAHEHVMLLLQNKCMVEARDILSQCQDCAIHIGESIEKSEGDGIKAVSYLEVYCEQLYQMSTTLDKKKLKRLKIQMDESIRCVEYEIEEKIPLDKKKIVFMPYKASMWDCMESIWEAAAEDKECNVYVVPIPYYEKNSDGSLKKLCYDGKQFPEYVPIISYEEFSIEIEHPDIIYIHNPYDGANYVTSVHPDYYSSELKKYTNLLIYVPYYFCGDGPLPEAHQNLPAYQNIDKIIVQDKVKADSLSEHVNEDKIVVIGSAKVDRILKLNRRKTEILEKDIPQEWKKKIGDKKVILFNVSISGLLQNSKYAIDKIRYILSEFEIRDDIVLLWRPHPLLEATLYSMRSELYEEYIEIKNLFLEKQNGIYDETGDAAIAAVISDAYLGEASSSLVHYFGVLGKPVFYINWSVLGHKHGERNLLKVPLLFKEENSLFFVPINKGLGHDFFQLNLKSGDIQRILTFPGFPDNVWWCYNGIKKLNNKILLIPYNTADIYIYDLSKQNAKKIVLSEVHNNTALFTNALQYKNKLYLLPSMYPAIVSIDMDTLEVCEFKQCIKSFSMKKEDPLLFSCAYIKKEKYLYLAGGNESKVIIFDMENEGYEIKKIGEYSFGYGNMIYDGDYFWLSAYKENCIVRWDEKTGETEIYDVPQKGQRRKDEIWSVLLNYNDEVMVCDGHSLDITFINKETGKQRKEKTVENMLAEIKRKSGDGKGGFLFTDFLDSETIIFIEKNGIYIWNVSTNQWRGYSCRLSRSEMLSLERKQIEKYYIDRATPYSLTENVIGISQYVDYIAGGNTKVFQKSYECYQTDIESVGTKIHEYIKNKCL